MLNGRPPSPIRLLAEEDRAAGIDQDRQRDQRQQRRERDQQRRRDDHVHRPLQRHRGARRVAEAEVEHRQLGQAVELDPLAEQAVVLGQEGEPEAGRLALLDQPLGRRLAHLLFGDDDALDRVLAGGLRDLRHRAEARQLGGDRLGLDGEVADQRQPRLRVGGDAAGDDVDRRRRADHDPGRDPGQPVPEEADDAAQDEAAGEGAEPDRDRGGGGEGADRAQRQQAVEDEDAEGAGRDQRRQLVEGAVADPAVVVVVEAVDLDDEDPDRAEEERPEEGADRGAGGRRR